MSQHVRWTPLARMVGTLFAAGLIPACNYSSSGKSYSMAPGGPMSLFADDFSMGFPGSHWTAPVSDAGGNGTAAVATSAGNPAPSLGFSSKARPGSISTTTQTHFTGFQVTLSVQVQASSTMADSVTVQIFDQTPTLVARALYNASTGAVTFSVGATSAGTVATTGMFHTFAFHVDASYNASGSLDGGAGMALSPGFFPVGGLVTLGLRSDFGGTTGAVPTFLLDNVSVTTP